MNFDSQIKPDQAKLLCPCCKHQSETAAWVAEIFCRLQTVPGGSIILTAQIQNEIIDLITDFGEAHSLSTANIHWRQVMKT